MIKKPFRFVVFLCLSFVVSCSAPGSSEKPASVRVAGIVLKWIRGEGCKETNFRRAVPLIREAAAGGAKIVMTTECFLDGYSVKDRKIPDESYRALGEPIPGGVYFNRLSDMADELDIYLLAGLSEDQDELRRNTAVLIGPDGIIIGKYHKQHIGHEKGRNVPGDASPVFETPFGKIGIMICADRRYPDSIRRFRENGADFLLCPSGGMFGPKKNDHHLQARSRENGVYIVFNHPAEFLVTAPDGNIVSRTILGDRLLIDKDQADSDVDSKRVFFFDIPL